jgi:hypothetical protein
MTDNPMSNIPGRITASAEMVQPAGAELCEFAGMSAEQQTAELARKRERLTELERIAFGQGPRWQTTAGRRRNDP